MSEPILTVDHLVKSYDGQTNILDNVSFGVQPGEVIVVVGPSGCGKSTLLRCLNGLEPVQAGRVQLGSETVAYGGKNLAALRQRIGMVFQSYELFPHLTVLDNILLAPTKVQKRPKAEVQQEAEALLDRVGLLQKAKSYPRELSGGQKQRAAIARALASDPEILLCDEATSALDPQTTEAILKLLKSLNAKLGLTIVLITHQMNVVKEICDRTAVMENGRVVEQGDVFEIFANPQQPVTRAFVDTTSCLSGINTLIEEKSPLVQLKPGQKILRFKYLERSACEALVSTISRKFNVDLNIVFGSIEIIGDNPIGGLVVIADGNEDDIRAAVKYLCDINVGVEVILSA